MVRYAAAFWTGGTRGRFGAGAMFGDVVFAAPRLRLVLDDQDGGVVIEVVACDLVG